MRYVIMKSKIDNPRFYKSMKEISKDTANNEYMTYSKYRAIDFDDYKDEYIQRFEKPASLASNDALIVDNNEYVFIEFKNGKIFAFDDRTREYGKKSKHQIYKKIYDSLLILMDIEDMTVKEAREKVSYMLVYNRKKNLNSGGKAINRISGSIRSYGSFDDPLKIKNVFEEVFIKHVYIYDKKRFNQYISLREK